MFKWRIPLSDLDYGAEEESAVLRVLHSKWLSMGPEVEAFEREFAAFLGTRYAVAVSSATAALHLAYLALDLGPGDEIIQPALNFVAAANMTVAIGANPVFTDVVGLDEPNLDPADIERRITSRTKAVVVMHYGGYLCRMAEILDLCNAEGVALIEDACHAVGARYLDPTSRPPHKAQAGSIGDMGCFSFFSNKNLVTGEGGMVVTNRDDLAQRLRRLRSHGMTVLTWDRQKGHASSYDVIANGYNYRLDELRAALGRSQLKKLEGNNTRRESLVHEYRRRLTALCGWVVPFAQSAGDSAYHLMVAVAPDERTRNQVAQALREAGIQTSLHYPFLPGFKAFARFSGTDLERSRAFAQRAISLPLFPTMTASQVEEVCSVMLQCAARGEVAVGHV